MRRRPRSSRWTGTCRAARPPRRRRTAPSTAPASPPYDQEANNWWEGGEAVCYGGWKRGSYPCEDGYHREGTYSARGVDYESTRLTTNCHGRNAWRWKGFRCSDAVTTATFDDGTEYTGVTIAACTLTQQELANPIPEEPDDEGAEDQGDDAGDSATASRATPAPALVPSLHQMTGDPLRAAPPARPHARAARLALCRGAAGVLVRGAAGSGAAARRVAGCAAGFANSGST